MNKILLLLNTVSLTVLAVGIIFLLFRYKGNLSRLLLVITFIIWFFRFLAGFILQFNNVDIDGYNLFFAPIALFGGASVVVPVLWYIIEVVRPGWINWKRALYILSPLLGLFGFYHLVLMLLNEKVIELQNFTEFRVHFFSFNVWFRLVLFAMTFVYLVLVHAASTMYKSDYDKWCMDNFSNTEKSDISWMKYFAFGLGLNTIAYTAMVFGNKDLSFISHQIIIQLTFLLALYKELFHESPYPKHFFENTMNEALALKNEEIAVICSEAEESSEAEDNNELFSKNLPEYKRTVEEWMQSYRPYLRPDLKLRDVAEALPLNRTYLSKVFNEGFGESFSQVVARYRVENAKKMLQTCPEMPIKEVILQSGFSSNSTFNPIFLKETGMTPKEFRERII